MAIVQNTLIGRAKGRVGNVVFTTHKGQNVLKQKPEIVANPRSAQQQANRARFISLMALGRTLRPILCQGFKEYAHKMSWLNRFMSTNATNDLMVWNIDQNEWDVDFSKIVISEGQLMPSLIDVAHDGTMLNLSWIQTPIANQSGNDRLFVVVMHGGNTYYGLGDNKRSEGATTPVYIGMQVDDIFVSYFWQSPDGRIVSNSYTAAILKP